ncbi:MAG TPA: DUF1349 domain-containing protein, partial [Tepidisphaeraceae bacterium]|nr:DUF1349 domain-containing protein [Tepidisphaeraceae bacterium]
WGINTADWVIEAGGTNPSVNTGNINVAVNDFNAPSAGASAPAVTYSAPTTTPTTTSAPTTTATTTTATKTTTPTTTSTPTSSGSTSLPSGWADSDIGGVGRSGAASYSNGVYSVAGSGEDVYGNSDSFNYAYQTVNGNSSITARVTSSQKTSTYSKAGIMVRSSLSSNAANVYLYQQANGQIIMSDRTSTGGGTGDAGAVNSGLPVWLRLVVSGNTIQGYYSTNGSTFTLVGTVNLSLPSSAYAGLAVCAQNTGALDTATFDNVSVNS